MRSTSEKPTIVALCGSLADDSVTRRALDRALESARDRGAETELIDPREYDLPLLDPDGDPPADARRLADRIDGADALLLGTPMYNGSVASPLKTAVDYSDPESFDDLPVGLVGVAGGQFPMRALDHLRAIASHMGARVRPDEVAIPESYRVDEELPADVADRLDGLGAALAAVASDRPVETGRARTPAGD